MPSSVPSGRATIQSTISVSERLWSCPNWYPTTIPMWFQLRPKIRSAWRLSTATKTCSSRPAESRSRVVAKKLLFQPVSIAPRQLIQTQSIPEAHTRKSVRIGHTQANPPRPCPTTVPFSEGSRPSSVSTSGFPTGPCARLDQAAAHRGAPAPRASATMPSIAFAFEPLPRPSPQLPSLDFFRVDGIAPGPTQRIHACRAGSDWRGGLERTRC